MSEPLTAPYEHATQMRDHWWWRPGWRPGRRFYGIFATFEDAPALHRLVDQWQERLADVPGLDMVPRQWRHLTIQGVGFTDQVASDQFKEVTAKIDRHLMDVPAVKVRFGPLTIHQEALAVPAIPQEPLCEVRATIRTALAAVLGNDRVDGHADGYKPHVTVAYNSMDRVVVPTKVNSAVRTPIEPADVILRMVKLVELNRDHRMYQWVPKQALTLHQCGNTPPLSNVEP